MSPSKLSTHEKKKQKEEETENKKDGEKKRSFVEAQLLKKRKGKWGRLNHDEVHIPFSKSAVTSSLEVGGRGEEG